MASTVILRLTDDIDGSPDARRHRVSVDGQTVEIDLSAANWDAFLAAAQPLLRHGRRINPRSAASRPAAQAGRPSQARREQLAEIRAWAREHGYTVAERGRIPLQVTKAWRASKTVQEP